MIHIDIIRESDDQLRRSVWTFWYYDSRNALVLDSYREESRESRRQKKYRVNARYARLERRDVTITEAAAPLPADVVKEALDKFFSMVKVGKWEELR